MKCHNSERHYEKLPFSFHPVFIISYQINALFRSFRTHCSNFPAQIVVDHGGYFGCAANILLCGKSTSIRSMNTPKTAEDCRPCNPFNFRLLTGIKYTKITVWSSIGTRVLKRFLPIGYTTVCCSHVECEHQLAPRTVIYCSSRHVQSGWGLDDKNVSACHQLCFRASNLISATSGNFRLSLSSVFKLEGRQQSAHPIPLFSHGPSSYYNIHWIMEGKGRWCWYYQRTKGNEDLRGEWR